MGKLDGEGYWIESFEWEFLGGEGLPFAVMDVSGEKSWSDSDSNEQPASCDYSAHLLDFAQTRVTRLEVRDYTQWDSEPKGRCRR